MAINSEVEICNMALSHLGNYGTISDIENPVDDKEVSFALWYDVTRQAALRLVIPNFAMARRKVAQKSSTPAFGYTYEYEYPADCLKVLGFGDIDEKDLEYSVEGDSIMMDEDHEDGLPLRFISDLTDVSKMTPDFKILFSWMLAANVALEVTQKQAVADSIRSQLPSKISEISGVNAQENPPVRRSVSKLKQARYSNPIRNGSKK